MSLKKKMNFLLIKVQRERREHANFVFVRARNKKTQTGFEMSFCIEMNSTLFTHHRVRTAPLTHPLPLLPPVPLLATNLARVRQERLAHQARPVVAPAFFALAVPVQGVPRAWLHAEPIVLILLQASLERPHHRMARRAPLRRGCGALRLPLF